VKEYLVKRYLRHLWIGLAAGLAASPALLATQRNLYLALALAGAIGVSFALVFRHSQGAYIDSLSIRHSAVGFFQHHYLPDHPGADATVD
jgi:hypothetical protein